jgi:CBS domain-containing protein
LQKNVADIMTRDVISVPPDMHVREVAETLVHNCISAVPVLNLEGRVVGIVSEGDLLRRSEVGTEFPRHWWSEIVGDAEAAAFRYIKSHGRQARHVMTPRPMTATEEMPVRELVALFEKHRVKRFPVIRGGRLVGIVSRADLVRALGEAPEKSWNREALDDEKIEANVLANIGSLPSLRGAVFVTVQEGVVRLRGLISSELEREAAHVAALNTRGVRGVHDGLFVRSRIVV